MTQLKQQKLNDLQRNEQRNERKVNERPNTTRHNQTNACMQRTDAPSPPLLGSLDYVILEKASTTAYQALWIEISFTDKKHIVCGIIYRQHNSPEQFQNYFADTVEKFISSGKTLCLMRDINIDLLKSTHCHFTHDFLSTLLSCYLIPTIDKPTRVHRSSATLIRA